MNEKVFLLLNLALAFYLAGAIWAHEVDIFRTWKLVCARDFPIIQATHWRKLPYWIFAPLGFALIGSVVLIWYHPTMTPQWAIWGNLGAHVASHFLTGLFWGRWQAALSKDERGPASPYLTKILATHWMRTALISAYGVILLVGTIQTFA